MGLFSLLKHAGWSTITVFDCLGNSRLKLTAIQQPVLKPNTVRFASRKRPHRGESKGTIGSKVSGIVMFGTFMMMVIIHSLRGIGKKPKRSGRGRTTAFFRD